MMKRYIYIVLISFLLVGCHNINTSCRLYSLFGLGTCNPHVITRKMKLIANNEEICTDFYIIIEAPWFSPMEFDAPYLEDILKMERDIHPLRVTCHIVNNKIVSYSNEKVLDYVSINNDGVLTVRYPTYFVHQTTIELRAKANPPRIIPRCHRYLLFELDEREVETMAAYLTR